MKKNKWVVPVLALVFVLMMAGTYLLYDRLAAGTENGISAAPPQESVPVEETPDETEHPAVTETPEEAEPSSAPEEELAMAPDFTVYDGEGNPVKLSDFVGTPVVVNFWASWCVPCKSEMPAFDALCARYEGRVAFLMVNLTDGSRETVAGASEFIRKQGYSFPVYFDSDSSAAMAYGVYSIPATYLIDAEGRAVAYGIGALSEDALESGIGMILERGSTG